MVVFAGQGDAQRAMSLLWRAHTGAARVSAPGPKQGLSVDEVVEAAIAIADAAGMPALSMRAVGERLGRTAMALYTYVPGKNELIDLMYDHVLGEMPTEYDVSGGWRAAVTLWAEDLWRTYLRHPWMVYVSSARPVLGPNEYLVTETVLRLLRHTGLDSETLRRVVWPLFHFVRGAAQAMAEAKQAAALTGMSDEDWWYARSAEFERLVPDFAERFPTIMWLESGRPPVPEDDPVPYMERESRTTFDDGLAVLLDGLQAAVTRNSS